MQWILHVHLICLDSSEIITFLQSHSRRWAGDTAFDISFSFVIFNSTLCSSLRNPINVVPKVRFYNLETTIIKIILETDDTGEHFQQRLPDIAMNIVMDASKM